MRSQAISALHETYDSFPLPLAVVVRNGVIVDAYIAQRLPRAGMSYHSAGYGAQPQKPHPAQG